MFGIQDNRIVICTLFGLGGILFIFLFLDSHYKALCQAQPQHESFREMLL